MAQEVANLPTALPGMSVPAVPTVPIADAAGHGALVSADHAVAHTAGHAHVEAEPMAKFETMKLAILLFIGSEVMFFTVLIGANLMARWKDPLPHEVLNIPLTALNTFILLTSSFTVVWAIGGIIQNNRKRFLRAQVASIIFGLMFVGVQAFEYTNLSHDGFMLSSNLYSNTFFALTGFHGSHVIIGLIWLTRLFVKGFNGHYSAKDYTEIELAGLYWHFVDIVWIFLFVLVYLM